MEKEIKYMIITAESFPFGWETYYFYIPVALHLTIGDVLTNKNGKQFRIVDGKKPYPLSEIDLTKYSLFE